jgi:carboxyl-terminal processing protease
VRSFAKENTCASVAAALKYFERSGVSGIALDLRDNPGGFVSQAVCVSGLLLGPDVLVAKFEHIPESDAGFIPGKSITGDQAFRKEFSVYTKEEQLTQKPLFVLVNQNTASASEIVAAALQDHGRAQVVGTRTFGKGSMQSAFQAWNDKELYLYRTTHLIVRPSGAGLQRDGVSPDFALSTEKKSFREANLYDNALNRYRPITFRENARPQKACHDALVNSSGDDALSTARALLHCSE